jgi:exosortase
MEIVGKLNQEINSFSINNDAITWRARLSFCALLTLWAYIFTPTLQSILFAITQYDNNQHIMFAIPLFLVLVYSKRSVFARISPSVGQFGLILLLLLSAFWVFAQIINIELLQQICVLAFIPAMFMLTFGYKISRVLIFPLSYIFLLLPIGNVITLNIQHWLLNNLVQAFAWMELPIYWEQHSIRTIHSVLDITILSHGLNFSLAFLSVGAVYAYFITLTFWRRLLIVLFFTLGPIFCVFVGFYFLVCCSSALCGLIMKPEQLVYYSWVLTSIGLLSGFLCGVLLKKDKPYADSLTKVDWRSSWRYSNFKWLRSTLLAAIIFGMIPLVTKNVQHNNPVGSYQEIIYKHPTIPSWEGPKTLIVDDWQPNFTTATKSSISGYTLGDSTVKLFSAYYYIPMQSFFTLIQDNNVLYNKELWKPIKVSHKIIHVKINKKFEIIETILSNGPKHIIMWHWYYFADTAAVNKFFLPLIDAMRIIFNKGDDVGVIAVATGVTDDVEHDRQLLQQFLTDIGTELKHLMYPRKAPNEFY